jgi:molybdopterin-containing oxidoreductase family iron-sulfur binding subunit
MVIDLDKCIGCQACSVACRLENNVSFVGPDEASAGRAVFWNEVFSHTVGEYPNVTTTIVPRPCFHCENPPCVKVCPVGATYRDEETGLVLQRYERCIGCRYCTVACPYGARYFNWRRPQWPEGMEQYQNPDIALRPMGIVEKCLFCVHRLEKGLPIPACNQACATGARYFGDLDDPDSEVARLARSPRAFRLLEDLGTEPNCIYLKEGL